MSREDDDLENDEGEEPKPSRYRRSKKTSPLLWILLAAVGLMLLGCCGVGGYFAFVRKAGTGVLSAGYPFTITGAKIKSISLPEGKYSPTVTVDFKANASADATDYYVVVQSHYAKATPGRDVKTVLRVPMRALATSRA